MKWLVKCTIVGRNLETADIEVQGHAYREQISYVLL